jgi:hypothetical protein
LQAVDVVAKQPPPPVGVEGCVVGLLRPYARRPLNALALPGHQRDRVSDTLTRLDRLLLAAARHLGHRVPGKVARGDPAVLSSRLGRPAQAGKQDLGEHRRPVRALRLRRLQVAARLEHERAALALETAGLLPYAAAEQVARGERAREATVQKDNLLARLGVVEQVAQYALDVERGGVQQGRIGVDGPEEKRLPVVVLDAVAGVVEQGKITGTPRAVELLDDLLHVRGRQIEAVFDAVEVAVGVQHRSQLFDVLADAGQGGELWVGAVRRGAEHQRVPAHQYVRSIAFRMMSIISEACAFVG